MNPNIGKYQAETAGCSFFIEHECLSTKSNNQGLYTEKRNGSVPPQRKVFQERFLSVNNDDGLSYFDFYHNIDGVMYWKGVHAFCPLRIWQRLLLMSPFDFSAPIDLKECIRPHILETQSGYPLQDDILAQIHGT